MKKIYLKKELVEVSNYQIEVIRSISEIVNILNENYGENRDVNKELGGHVLVVENIEDVKEIRNGILKDILPEYTDEIICSEGVNCLWKLENEGTAVCNSNSIRVDKANEYVFGKISELLSNEKMVKTIVDNINNTRRNNVETSKNKIERLDKKFRKAKK